MPTQFRSLVQGQRELRLRVLVPQRGDVEPRLQMMQAEHRSAAESAGGAGRSKRSPDGRADRVALRRSARLPPTSRGEILGDFVDRDLDIADAWTKCGCHGGSSCVILRSFHAAIPP
nr:hypothetical protein [Nocardia puris]